MRTATAAGVVVVKTTAPGGAGRGAAQPEVALVEGGGGFHVAHGRASRAVADVERRMLHALPAGAHERLREDLTACTAALDAAQP